jgi:anti-sigma28 factor (negative regulator of flagellin synthesis)
VKRELQPSCLLDHQRTLGAQTSSRRPPSNDPWANLAAALGAADVDDARLRSLAAQIQAGCYHLPSERIAKALLSEVKPQ